jgi:hypothetical protein
MKQIYFTLIFVGFLAAANAETFTGVITDTMCGAKHGMMRGQPDDQCVKICVKGPYVYALFDGTNIFKLSDQKAPAKFAAQQVILMGTLDAKTMRVSSIEPVGGK